jgi:DNA mismatch repair protein MutS
VDPTPMMKQYIQIKERYREAILFFRMGDFYEMFFEDAVEASGILQIALTSRGGRGTPSNAPMCGIPYHAAETYIAKLVRAGKKVAICEQVEDPKLARGIVRREVVRVITPGTVSDTAMLEAKENNFLASLASCGKETLAAAFLDVTTGAFRATESEGKEGRKKLLDEILKTRPSEIVHPASLDLKALLKSQDIEALLTPLDDGFFHPDYAGRLLREHFGVASLEGLGCGGKTCCIQAAGAVLHYARETQKTALKHITGFRFFHLGDSMALDAITIRNLELTKNMFDGTSKGTLLEVLDRTMTPMGGRLLRQWLLKPSLDLGIIRARLQAVTALTERRGQAEKLAKELQKVGDLERLLGKVTLRTANPRDLVSLRASLEPLGSIRAIALAVGSPMIEKAASDIDPLEDIASLIQKAVEDRPPLVVRDGGVIRDGYHAELDSLRKLSREAKQFIASLEAEERTATGIQNLKVRYNKVFGYYIEVSKANLPLVPERYDRKQTLVNCERFITPALKDFEEKVLTAEEKIGAIESELFLAILGQVEAGAGRIQRTAAAVAELDTLAALAAAAVRNDYVCPAVTGTDTIRITEGRHPVIELVPRAERFVPNDTFLDNDGNRILIITGPNMGGKSTYLRQVALIALMAQMGSYVPAATAEIGLIDRIFTRVGATDHLARGQSTFMVEMTETAHILNAATEKSLILLDEVGRGTSTFDGLSLAWALIEHLHQEKSVAAKTLFATHYHELTKLALTLEGVKNYHVTAKEWNQEIIFLRRVEEGTSDRSYGIEVARLAGIPDAVIRRSKEVLKTLERDELNLQGRPKLARSTGEEPGEPVQLPIFSPSSHPVLQEIKEVDLNEMKPLDALNLLDKLKRRLQEEDL